MSFGEAGDPSDFVLGEQLTDRGVDADFPADRVGDALVVAGDHHELPHVRAPECTEHLGGLCAGGVHHADDAEEPVATADDHQRLPGVPRLRVRVGQRAGQRELLLVEHAKVADVDPLAVDDRRDAATDDRVQVDRGEPLGLGDAGREVADDGLGERVIAEGFDGDESADQLGLGDIVGGRDGCHPGGTPGQGAGLVERHRLDSSERFERGAALHEHTGACRAGHARQHRGRGCDREGTGAGGDEDRHREVERVRERLREREPGEQEGHGNAEDHGGHVPTLEPVDELLGRGCCLVGGADEFDDLAERRVGGGRGDLDLEHAGPVHGAGEHSVCDGQGVDGAHRPLRVGHRLLLHRDRLSGDRGLVHCGNAGDHEPV